MSTFSINKNCLKMVTISAGLKSPLRVIVLVQGNQGMCSGSFPSPPMLPACHHPISHGNFTPPESLLTLLLHFVGPKMPQKGYPSIQYIPPTLYVILPPSVEYGKDCSAICHQPFCLVEQAGALSVGGSNFHPSCCCKVLNSFSV